MSTLRIFSLFLVAALIGCATVPVPSDPPPPAPAGEITSSIHNKPEVRALLDRLCAHDDWLVQQQISICQIEAPPFKERRRAEDVVARFRALGYPNARLDSIGNVVVERPGDPGGPVLVLSAHLDTVFPEGTDVTVKQSGDTLRGPGSGIPSITIGYGGTDRGTHSLSELWIRTADADLGPRWVLLTTLRLLDVR